MMTLEQFRATGRDCDDLATALASDFGDGPTAKGRLYADHYYIEDTSNWLRAPNAPPLPRWHLLLERQEYLSDTLADLERQLYAFCLISGGIPGLEELLTGALDAACKTIQDAIGQTDGGPAGTFFSGRRGDEFRRLMLEYLSLETFAG